MNVNPSMKEFKDQAAQGNLIPVCTESLADTETPVSIYLKLRQSLGSLSFLLESAEFGRTWDGLSRRACGECLDRSGEDHGP